MTRLLRLVLAPALFVAATTASLYVGHEHGEVGFHLIPLEFLTALAAGWAIGRWWAVPLAFVVIPLIVVAPFANETDSDGVSLRALAIVFGPLLSLWPLLGLALGVAGRKLTVRRRIARGESG